MTDKSPIADLLAVPLSSDWTVERLAEQLLDMLTSESPERTHQFVLDGDVPAEHQARRLIRPLLAYLAQKSAAEVGMPPTLYGGELAFERMNPNGPNWILGDFENRPGNVRLTLRRSSSPRENLEIPKVNHLLTAPVAAPGDIRTVSATR